MARLLVHVQMVDYLPNPSHAADSTDEALSLALQNRPLQPNHSFRRHNAYRMRVRDKATERCTDAFDDDDIVRAIAPQCRSQRRRGPVCAMPSITTSGSDGATADGCRVAHAVAHSRSTARTAAGIQKVGEAGTDTGGGQERTSTIHITPRGPKCSAVSALLTRQLRCQPGRTQQAHVMRLLCGELHGSVVVTLPEWERVIWW